MEKGMGRKAEERKKELLDRKWRFREKEVARKVENGEMRKFFSFYILRRVI
jgi:hypothetical protein